MEIKEPAFTTAPEYKLPQELDQFMKRDMKARCYVRYADDFAIVSRDRNELEDLIPLVRRFLMERLKLD